MAIHVDVDGALAGAAGSGATKYIAADFHTSPSFQLGDPETDFGVVILHEPVGDTLGFFGMRSVGDEEIDGLLIDVDGYPVGSLQQAAVETGLLAGQSSNGFLAYAAGTREGQSGAPVWEASSDGVALAIHNYEAEGFDVGARLTPDVRQWIQRF
jgi:glutamyl endopeptidase